MMTKNLYNFSIMPLDTEHLEEICEKLGNKDDTWYATNYEIYEYVNAYLSLIYSADGSKIYNPTLKTIWLEIDDVPYAIKSGETIRVKAK